MHRLSRTLLLALPLAAAACSGNLSTTFELPKEEIQQKLAQKFPLQPGSETGEPSPLDLTISDPVVLLEEGKSQIGIRVKVLAETAAGPSAPALPRRPPGPPGAPAPPEPPAPLKPRFNGTATLFASVSYDPNGKSIHLSEPKITELQLAQLPDALSAPLSRIAEKALAQKFAEQPIPLESQTLTDKAVVTFLKSVTVKNGKLLVEIGW